MKGLRARRLACARVVCAALAVGAAGCVERVETTEGDWRRVPLRDVVRSGSLLGDVWNDQLRLAPHKRWLPPQRVGGEAGTRPVAANRLLRARLDIYPKVPCDMADAVLDANAVAGAVSDLLPVPGDVVGSLGDIVSTRTVMLVGAAQPETFMSPFAPLWMGVPLRLAGVGGTILFSARQNCADMTEAAADTLPQRGIGVQDVSIPARAPFTLTLLEACPLTVEVQELRTVRYLPIQMRLYYGVNYWAYYRKRMRLRADCADGDVIQEASPLDMPPHDYRPTDPRLDPERLGPQRAWSDDDA